MTKEIKQGKIVESTTVAAPVQKTVVEEVVSFSSKPVKNSEVRSSAPPQKKPEVAELKASAPEIKDTKA